MRNPPGNPFGPSSNPFGIVGDLSEIPGGGTHLINAVTYVHAGQADFCVVVDRIGLVAPLYCGHARTRCHTCCRWVWLGDKSERMVVAGAVDPICRQCYAYFTGLGVHVATVDPQDHQRRDGPH